MTLKTSLLLMGFVFLHGKMVNISSPLPKEISKTTLLTMKTVYEITSSNQGCQIVGYHVTYLKEKSAEAYEMIVRGDSLTQKVRRLFLASEAGDYLYFTNINSVNDCLKYQGKGDSVFVVLVK